MLFSSALDLWILHGNLLQIFSPQVKEFKRAHQCHREAPSAGDLLGLWKLAVPWRPQIYRVPGWAWGGHRTGSKNSSTSLSFQGGRGGVPSTGKVCLCLWTCTWALMSSSSPFALHRKKMITSTFPRKTLKSLSSMEKARRQIALLKILLEIKISPPSFAKLNTSLLQTALPPLPRKFEWVAWQSYPLVFPSVGAFLG